MTWFLDGNNLMGFLRRDAEKGSRESFLEWLLERGVPSPSVVVFDGPPPPEAAAHTLRRGKVWVLYAGKATADSAILARVLPGDRVVTADRELALRCRDRRAQIVAPGRFFASMRPGRVEGGEKPSATAVDVDAWLQFFRRDAEE
ncbi:MAG: hypothetical protein ACP5VF_05545 [Acidobacteriota bacterium]